MIKFLILLSLFATPALGDALPIVTVTEEPGATQYSLTLQLLALMTYCQFFRRCYLLIFCMNHHCTVTATAGTGTMQTPPNTVLVGIALFLTFFVMAPVFNSVYDTAILPFLNEEISIEAAIAAAEVPVRGFMLNQTRQEDIGMFVEIVGMEAIPAPEEVPFSILAPAFITSELKSAFVIAFMIYIPFIVIDLIVASVLMSMGMMMLSPMMISMPFKLMLFVLVDGWTLG